MNLLIPIIPTIIFIILCVVPLSTIIFIFKKQTRGKKSPLNMELLRGPGQISQVEIEELNTAILIKALFIPLIPITLYSIYATQVAITAKDLDSSVLYVYLLGAAAFIFSLSRDVYNMIKERNVLRLGHECEVAVGQEISQLASLGFHIFHDFPAENFTINHIAVGPQGVFAIETKARAQKEKQKKDTWQLQFDGVKLIFPGWVEEQPVQQAKDQSSWLSEWLANATGGKFKTTAVLALPGWQIDSLASNDLQVFNGRNPEFISKGPVMLNEKQIKSIACHIEKQCRDVETKV